jgi:uncharacterized protein (DUF885 family)
MELYNQYYKEILKMNPTMSTFVGFHSDNDKYENIYSKEYIDNSKSLLLKYKKLNDKVKNKDYHNKLLDYELKMSLNSYKYKFELLPIDQESIIPTVIQMVNDKFFPQDTVNDYKNIMKRYKDIKVVCDTMIENMRKGIKMGYVQPKRIIKLVIDQYTSILKNKEYNIKVPKQIHKEYYEVLDTYFVSSIRKILHFLKKEYYPKCRITIGYYDYPNGRNMYQYLANYYTTTDMSVEEIHNLGLKEVARINQEMINTKNNTDFKGSLKQFHTFMKNDKQFQYKNRKDALKGYKNEQNLINSTVMNKYFYKMDGSNSKYVSHDYGIKAIPKYQEQDAPGAYYYMPSKDLKRKGNFYLNMYDLTGVTKYTVRALSLHEGNPGHHYQLTLIIDKKLPLYIIYSNHIAYIEGWALYAESLGDYTDMYIYYGRLSYEMLRALRLVIDTGIHHYKWSYNKTLKYFKKYFNGSNTEIVNEIHRYIADPGQALAYKIGELTILDLRKKWKGDIKDFHKKILENGPTPINLLIKEFD